MNSAKKETTLSICLRTGPATEISYLSHSWPHERKANSLSRIRPCFSEFSKIRFENQITTFDIGLGVSLELRSSFPYHSAVAVV
jgi:hypothetical protein